MFRLCRKVAVLSGLLVAFLGLSSGLFAQDPETVYFTGPDNAISKVTSFPNGTAEIVAVDNGTNFKGLVVRNDDTTGLTLIVANSTQGGGIRAYTGSGGNLGQIAPFSSVVGVALDAGGNVYAVNADPGGSDALLYVPHNTTCGTSSEQGTCNAGGYGDPVTLDHQVNGASLLADVKFVSSPGQDASYDAGDVLVLVEQPAMLLRYKRADIESAIVAKQADPNAADVEPTSSAVIPSASFGGTEPTSFAFGPSGEILVGTVQGRILRFNPSGTPGTPFDFFSGLGTIEKVSVGLQGGVNEVFATIHQGGSVQRFKFNTDGTGLADGSVEANSPHGVGNASLSDSVSVRASSTPISIAPTAAHVLTFEQVTLPGAAKSKVFLVQDPNPFNDRVLSGIDPSLPPLTVPAYIRAFLLNGVPTFVLMVTDSSADIFRFTLEHHIHEEELGFDTHCKTSTEDPSPEQPRTFYGVDLDDPPIVEGTTFTDISSGCGSNFGRGGGTSAILTAWDSRSLHDVAGDKLSNLQLALQGTDSNTGGLAPFITGSSTKRALNNYLNKAMRAFNSGKSSTAQSNLQSFIDTITSSAGSFRECLSSSGPCRNAPGELKARAESAIFILCGASSSCNRPLAPNP